MFAFKWAILHEFWWENVKVRSMLKKSDWNKHPVAYQLERLATQNIRLFPFSVLVWSLPANLLKVVNDRNLSFGFGFGRNSDFGRVSVSAETHLSFGRNLKSKIFLQKLLFFIKFRTKLKIFAPILNFSFRNKHIFV